MCCCLMRERERERERIKKREDFMLDGESQGKCEKDNNKKEKSYLF